MNTFYLSFILFLTIQCDDTFTHFTKKQCQIHGNCIKNDNSILIAVDGTGSRQMFEDDNKPRKFKSNIGIYNNKKWIWQSHVANFWEEYQGESHYFYGPDSNEMLFAGNEVSETVEISHLRVCRFINNYFQKHDISKDDISATLIKNMSLNGEFGVDVIGFSRGGFAAMHLSRKLQFDGCDIYDMHIAPIYVRWMGLYDPVERDLRYKDILNLFSSQYAEDQIAENVLSVAIAERSEYIHSRSYFGYAVDPENHRKDKKRFNASHSGMGGAPGRGDCDEQTTCIHILSHFAHICNPMDCVETYTVNMDNQAAMETDLWIRSNAINAKVPITECNEDYYGNFIDLF